MITVTQNQLYLNKCTFSNILCNGDGDDSSLITFNSYENINTIRLENSKIDNCKSNGDLIKISGKLSIIEFINVNINNIISYGSILYNNALNVSKKYIYIYQIKYNDNNNNNKYIIIFF